MATIFTNIEAVLSDVESIVSLAANEVRLVAEVTALSALSVYPPHTIAQLPACSANGIASASASAYVFKSLDRAQATALGNVAGSEFSIVHILRSTVAQLSDASALLERHRSCVANAKSLSFFVPVDIKFTKTFVSNPTALPFVSLTSLNTGLSITSNPTALASVSPSDFTARKFISKTLSQLSLVTTDLSEVSPLRASPAQLNSSSGLMSKAKSLKSEAKCLGSVFGHFAPGRFVSSHVTQLAEVFGFLKEGFALKCSAKALNKISVADIRVFPALHGSAKQLAHVAVILDVEPFLRATAKCITSCRGLKVTTVNKTKGKAKQLASLAGSLQAREALTAQAHQLAIAVPHLRRHLTCDGSANAHNYFSSSALTPKIAIKSYPKQLTLVIADHIAFLSKLKSFSLAIASVAETHLSLTRPIKATVTALSNVLGLSTCTKFMRNSRAEQTTSVVSKLITYIYFKKTGNQLTGIASSTLGITSKFIASASQLASSAPVLTEHIELSGDASSLATVVESFLKPTKRLPGSHMVQLTKLTGNMLNNWTGVYSHFTTQLSSASVVKIATLAVLEAAPIALTSVSGTELKYSTTLDGHLTQLAFSPSALEAHREIASSVAQISDISSKFNLFKVLSKELSQLSNLHGTLSIPVNRLVSTSSQLATVTSKIVCTKRLSARPAALSSVRAHVFSGTDLIATASQLSFVSAQLGSQMRASVTQLAVTYGRIRGSTLGRIYKPTLELYTA